MKRTNNAGFLGPLPNLISVNKRLLALFLLFVGFSVHAPAAPQPLDTDGDGLSDYQEMHKYGTDPHKRSTSDGKPDSDARQRKEFTYTITTVMRILKPADPSVMTDDYQDVRVLSQDKDSYTVEITYYPFNTNALAIDADPNWRKDDAAQAAYLMSTPAVNWDASMRRDLVAALKRDDIDPDRLTDRDLVARVSTWAMTRASTTDAFAIWDVYFPHGKAAVYPPLQAAFDGQKPDASWSTQAMLDHEVLGRQMFYNKVHGSCTSSSVYMATILRALGIPTRIVVCIPPADGNDPAQVALLLSAVHHHRARLAIEDGLSESRGFANHLFNEVYLGHHWVRLNYDNLGQNILDKSYFGLLTHIATCRDISDLPLARTWGVRFNGKAYDQPSLSSVNPYMLLSASDHFGRHSHVPNPEMPVIRSLTIDKIYWRGDPLPRQLGTDIWDHFPRLDLLVSVLGWTPDEYHDVPRAAQSIGPHFVLRAAGHPDVTLVIRRGDISYTSSEGGFMGLTATIAPDEKAKLVPGVVYTLHPADTPPAGSAWVVPETLTVTAPK